MLGDQYPLQSQTDLLANVIPRLVTQTTPLTQVYLKMEIIANSSYRAVLK